MCSPRRDWPAQKRCWMFDDDAFGDLGYRLGAAFLVPYPNRIRGKLSADGKTLTTAVARPPAHAARQQHRQAARRRAARHARPHPQGKDRRIRQSETPGGEQVTGVIHAGDFGGHWLSKTDLVITVTLTAGAVDATIVAHNVGLEEEPIAIGWHPYFNLPSGDRTQARLHIPGSHDTPR